MAIPNEPTRYSVGYSDAVTARLRAWGDLAKRLGSVPSYLAALKELTDRLERDPRSWGDPLRDLRAMKVTVYRHLGPLLLVLYAVHHEQPVVLVQNVFLTPGSPMQDADGDPPVT